MRKSLLVLASTSLALLTALGVGGFVETPPAGAAFPGKNGKIAFVSNRDVGAGEIYAMQPDGTGTTRLTFRTGGNGDPAFSPDGTRIAFKNSANDIYVMGADGMNPDGTGAQRLTSSPVVESDPTFSPDGTKIAFVASAFEVDGSTDLEIWVMNADGTGRTLLTDNSYPDTQPAWSPNGDRIAFVSSRRDLGDTDRNVYVMNADGTGQTNVTQSTTGNPPYQGNDDDPTWSPDGSKIAYVHTFAPNASGVPNIWTMDPTGAGKTNVSNNANTSAIMPSWSPDGSKIAYVGSDQGSTDRNIYAMNSDGTGQTILQANAANDIAPEWQQDSIPPQTTITAGPEGIVRSTSASFAFVSSETGSVFQCSLDGAAFSPCASPRAYAVANGSHSFRVRATDAAGNVDATPALRTWTVDTVLPTVSGMLPRNASTTADATPTIRATVKDNLTNLQKANIKLYVNGALISPSRYSYSASTDALVYNSPALAKGRKNVRITATDAAGNVRNTSWYFTIT